MKNRKANWLYAILWVIVAIALYIWHPFTKIRGRDHIPAGGCLICGNHSAMSDPLWVLLALGPRSGAYVMGKQELMSVPVLRNLLQWVGMINVDRGAADLAAVKQSLEVLKNDEKLIVFPEGTRVRPGETVEAKTGAALMANRGGVPVLPVYITQRKRPFCPIKVTFGAPYEVKSAARRITSPELTQATVQLMDTIYALESVV